MTSLWRRFVSDSFQVFRSRSCKFSKVLVELGWRVGSLKSFSICTLSRTCLCHQHKRAAGNHVIPGPSLCPLLLLLQKVGLWSLRFTSHVCPLRSKTAAYTDDRIRTVSEVITGIRTVKMYTWEKSIMDLIARLRR